MSKNYNIYKVICDLCFTQDVLGKEENRYNIMKYISYEHAGWQLVNGHDICPRCVCAIEKAAMLGLIDNSKHNIEDTRSFVSIYGVPFCDSTGSQ